jgi:hypothetical protein
MEKSTPLTYSTEMEKPLSFRVVFFVSLSASKNMGGKVAHNRLNCALQIGFWGKDPISGKNLLGTSQPDNKIMTVHSHCKLAAFTYFRFEGCARTVSQARLNGERIWCVDGI